MNTQANFDAVLSSVDQLVQKSVADGLLTHAVALYGRLSENAPLFQYRWLPEGRDIFDLASMTKALVTTPLIFQSLRTRGLPLDSTIDQWLGKTLSQVLDPRLRALTVESILRHQSGLPAWRNFWVCHLGVDDPHVLYSPRAIRERLLEGLNRAAITLPTPMPRPLYSDIGFLLLGFCLTECEQRPLSDLFWEMLEKSLNMPLDHLNLCFGVEGHNRLRAVPTAFCALRGRNLVGEVHDENAASLGGLQGHAGLFGTGDAVAALLAALSRSSLGQGVLQRNAKAIVLPPGDPPNEGLLGWRQGADSSSWPFAQGNAMGHMGFTGVAFWVCPSAQDYAILLTNRVSGGRTRPGIAALRRDIFSALALLRS